VKVSAIHHGADVQAKLDELLTAGALARIVWRAERDVMHGARATASVLRVWHAEQVNHSARSCRVWRSKAEAVALLLHQFVAEHFR